MKKLLIVCPSRGRYIRIGELLRSLNKTINHNHSDVLILLDKDDPQLENYKRTLPRWVKYEVFDKSEDETLTTNIINKTFEKYNDYDFYSVTNDDIVYKTRGWDEALSQPLKISSCQDDTQYEKFGNQYIGNIQPATFPSTSIICGDICRALGWLQFPEIIHSCGDNVWFWLGQRNNCLYANIDYHLDHNSPYFDRGEKDETYLNCNGLDNKADYYTFKEWLKYRCGKYMLIVEKLTKGSNDNIVCGSVNTATV